MKHFLSLGLFLLSLYAGCARADSANNSLFQKSMTEPSFFSTDLMAMGIIATRQEETEYLPEIKGDLYAWQEESVELRFRTRMQENQLSFGIEQGRIEQKNLFFHDTDFDLDRRSVAVGWERVWSPTLSSALSVRCEEYADHDGQSYYRLGHDKQLWTGQAILRYRQPSWWGELSYSRERDPEPVYDLISDRAALNLRAQELTGINLGWLWNREWETVAGLYYEAYGSHRPDQLNYTVQTLYRPLGFKELTAALGAGYYTEEQETIVNLTLRYSKTLSQQLALEGEYQLEYSDDEQSWLNQGLASVRWKIAAAWQLRGTIEYSRESGEDRDESLLLLAQLDYLFD
ncbi:MAG: hypothetical protein JXR59_03685 [Desulfuromonadaceae bacterium]|nr:hypothetical protein [Desulfuromonadaceae bacterium]